MNSNCLESFKLQMVKIWMVRVEVVDPRAVLMKRRRRIEYSPTRRPKWRWPNSKSSTPTSFWGR